MVFSAVRYTLGVYTYMHIFIRAGWGLLRLDVQGSLNFATTSWKIIQDTLLLSSLF